MRSLDEPLVGPESFAPAPCSTARAVGNVWGWSVLTDEAHAQLMTSHVKNLFASAVAAGDLSAYYERAMSFLTRERVWKARFFQEIAPRPGERILDHHCGTGVLTLLLYQACPDAEIMGLDVDRKALLTARMRARTSKARVTFWRGELNDCRAESFDKVACSLLPLSLGIEARRKVIRRAATLLRPGGSLHVADWETPDALNLLLVGRKKTREVAGERPCSIAELMQESGLGKTVKSYGHSTILGSIGFYRGTRL